MISEVLRLVMADPRLMSAFTAAATEGELFSMIADLARAHAIPVSETELGDAVRANRRAWLERWLPDTAPALALTGTSWNHKGWVPIRVGFHGPEVTVDWCWLGGRRFTEPFFDGDIELAQRMPFNALFTHRAPIGELGRWHEASPGLAPAGFIFHMSRCGSTLVSRMLAALPENIVLSEAGPVDRLARAVWIPEPARAEWLRWMIGALAQPRAGGETRCFVKFDSPTVVALPFIHRAFPDVPWIFLYRDPEEVLVSHLREPAAAMTPGVITDVPLVDAPMHEILAMSPEEYAARAIGKLCECAGSGMDERGIAVNYAQLPGAVAGEIARHFGLRFSSDESAFMRDAASSDAKRPRRKFVADGEMKRREATDSVRAAADRWISPHYRVIESMRKGGGAAGSQPLRRL